MNTFRWRWAGLALSLIASAGCATSYTVSEQDVQREIDRYLPVTLEQPIGGNKPGTTIGGLLTVEKLALRLPERAKEPLRLTGEGTLETRYAGFALAQPVSAELTGRLRYDAKAKQIVLTDAQLTSLDAPLLSRWLPAELYQNLLASAGQALVGALAEQPLYTLGDRNRAESVFRNRGTSIEMRNRQIIFSLD